MFQNVSGGQKPSEKSQTDSQIVKNKANVEKKHNIFLMKIWDELVKYKPVPFIGLRVKIT